MKNKNSIKQYIVGIVLGLGLVLGVASVQAQWVQPSQSPPGGNADAPINAGSLTQSKLGSLEINTAFPNPYAIGLQVFGESIFNGSLAIVDGTQAAGDILTSDASGNASWQTGPISHGAQSCGNDPTSGMPMYVVGLDSQGNVICKTVQTFSHSQLLDASGSFTVPSGITQISIQMWGGGGAGGAFTGGSGGGGGYASGLLAVSPATVIQFNVGAGGTTSAGNGGPGGMTYLSANGATTYAAASLSPLYASGGGGGVKGAGAGTFGARAGGGVGSGGPAATGVTTAFSQTGSNIRLSPDGVYRCDDNNVNGTTEVNGYGGQGANGGGAGGRCGNGDYGTITPTAGSIPGGGGGGGGGRPSSSQYNGAAGAHGRVVVFW